MRKYLPIATSLLVLFSFVAVRAQKKTQTVTPEDQWTHLIDANRIADAQKLCTGWEASTDKVKQIEAEKCLANVALSKGSRLSIQGNETGGGSLGEGYTTEAVDEAISHLNKGIALAPQDISIHEGRLHVLEVAGRYEQMMKALEESIQTYKGSGTPDVWLAYAPELADLGQPTAGLHLSEVLYKYYPENSDVIGNMGAFHNMLKEWDKGLPFERKAVDMHPSDPIDTWNLGWGLYQVGQMDEANKWMSRSFELDPKGTDVPNRSCLYGKFLVTEMKQEENGCKLVKANCDHEEQSVCK